ncbi:MAG: hypothetical protein V3R39_03510, partial [Nitrosopumilus sp.]
MDYLVEYQKILKQKKIFKNSKKSKNSSKKKSMKMHFETISCAGQYFSSCGLSYASKSSQHVHGHKMISTHPGKLVSAHHDSFWGVPCKAALCH